jgi:hypothetical protein
MLDIKSLILRQSEVDFFSSKIHINTATSKDLRKLSLRLYLLNRDLSILKNKAHELFSEVHTLYGDNYPVFSFHGYNSFLVTFPTGIQYILWFIDNILHFERWNNE